MKIEMNKEQYKNVLKAMHYTVAEERRKFPLAMEVDFDDIEIAVEHEWSGKNQFELKEYSLDELLKKVELFQYPVVE